MVYCSCNICIKGEKGKINPKDVSDDYKGACCGGKRGPGDGGSTECKKRGRTTCCQKCHREIKWWLSTETRKSLEERKMSKLEVLGLNEEAREDVEQKSRKRARDGAERDDEAA